MIAEQHTSHDLLQARAIAAELAARQMADEIDRLRAENKQLGDRWNDISYERNDLKAEIERLTHERDDALECERQHAERLNRVVEGHKQIKTENERLREAIVMAENRLECADCPACVDVARSYLRGALGQTDWPRAQQAARDADPRPAEDIVRQMRDDEWRS